MKPAIIFLLNMIFLTGCQNSPSNNPGTAKTAPVTSNTNKKPVKTIASQKKPVKPITKKPENDSEPKLEIRHLGVGIAHGCAIDEDDKAFCWGTEQDGNVQNPSQKPLKSLFTDDRFTCGVTIAEGFLSCWAHEDAVTKTNPTFEVLNFSSFTGVALAVKKDLSIAIFGGDNLFTNLLNKKAKKVAVGAYQSGACIIGTDNKIFCDVIFSGSSPQSYVTNVPPDEVSDFDLASSFGCAIKKDDQHPLCWGENRENVISNTPKEKVTGVRVGDDFACARKASDSTLICWGGDSEGQVSGAPVDPVIEFDANGSYACAVMEDRHITCWGKKPPSGPPAKKVKAR